jgi:hypothetical protein
MTAGTYLGAMRYERAHLVRERLYLRDDCLLVEGVERSAGSKKLPLPG